MKKKKQTYIAEQREISYLIAHSALSQEEYSQSFPDVERLQIHLKFCCVASDLEQQLLLSVPCSSGSPVTADPVSPSSA